MDQSLRCGWLRSRAARLDTIDLLVLFRDLVPSGEPIDHLHTHLEALRNAIPSNPSICAGSQILTSSVALNSQIRHRFLVVLDKAQLDSLDTFLILVLNAIAISCRSKHERLESLASKSRGPT